MAAGAINVVALVAGIVASLISGWVMYQYTRRQARAEAVEQRVHELEIKMASQVGEDRLREIIRDELAKWELCMMKDGRIGRRNG
jgi:hypothetical protein